jgi:putative membrane protein
VATEESRPADRPVPSPAPKKALIARSRSAVRAWWADVSHSGPHATHDGEQTANEMAATRTRLATERTLMAADRSLMAWVRTGLSMISFGFTIYKILEGFEKSAGGLPHGGSPRAVGLFLTGLGTVSMVMGLVEYWYRLRALRSQGPYRILQPSFVMAMLVTVMGLFLFVGIISQLL